jgi:dUTP pyrophosphatase
MSKSAVKAAAAADEAESIGPVLKFHTTNERIPAYESAGAAGFDIAISEEVVIPRWQHRIAHTGLFVEVPEGYELQIRSRSSLAAKHGGFILNSPGTVDSDYRGEIMLVIANPGLGLIRLDKGMRVAQGVLAPVTRATLKQVKLAELTPTARGDGRFGSTGS